MNKIDIKKIVESGNIRSFYGGNYEPAYHAFTFILIISFLFLILGYQGVETLLFIFIIPYACFQLLLCSSYFYIAKVHSIGQISEEEFIMLKSKYNNDNYITKAKGKNFIEFYKPLKKLLSKDIHITLFLYDGCLYASAWRYAHGFRFGPYLYFESGKKELNKIKSLLPC